MKQDRTHSRDQGADDRWFGFDHGGDDRTAFSSRCTCGKYWTANCADTLRSAIVADPCGCRK